MYLSCPAKCVLTHPGSHGPAFRRHNRRGRAIHRREEFFMRRLLVVVVMFLLTAGLWAQTAPPAANDAAQLRQEIDQLKKTINSLEQRLDNQEQATKAVAAQASPTTAPVAKEDPIKDLQT